MFHIIYNIFKFHNCFDDGEGKISNPFNLVSFRESLGVPYANLL